MASTNIFPMQFALFGSVKKEERLGRLVSLILMVALQFPRMHTKKTTCT